MMDSALVPYDASEPSRTALGYAREKYDPESIVVLHAIEERGPYGFAGEVDLVVPNERLMTRSRDRAERMLRDGIEAVGMPADLPSTVVRIGQPATVVVEYAREHPIREIVIGSHCRTGASRLVHGSVAESIVRRSPVPVTVVPRPDRPVAGANR